MRAQFFLFSYGCAQMTIASHMLCIGEYHWERGQQLVRRRQALFGNVVFVVASLVLASQYLWRSGRCEGSSCAVSI